MSLFERAHVAVANVTCGRPVVFHHVPKCGGTSIERALRLRYAASYATFDLPAIYNAAETIKPGSSLDTLDVLSAHFRSTELLAYLFHGVRCIAGHVYLSNLAIEQFSSKYVFVSTLRDPIDFFISFYYQMLNAREPRWKIDMPLEDFISTARARLLGQFYVLYFSGTGFSLSEIESRNCVTEAKNNIARLTAVGFVDDMPGFQRQLNELLGVRLWVGHANRSQASQAERASLTRDLKQKIEDLSQANIEVYNFARERFFKQ